MVNPRWIAMAAAALVVAGATAEAKTVEEILRDKGVITEDEYKDATAKSGTARYEPGRGIVVESRDGKFSAAVGGRLQTRYSYTDFEDGDTEDKSELTIRKANVWWEGNVFSKDLKFKYAHNFNEGKSVTEDAYLSYRFLTPLALTVGQFKSPQARQELTSSGRQLFVDRSLANAYFKFGYDIGAQLSGSVADGRFEYAAGVFNGNGGNKGNHGNENLYAARVDVNPLGAFKMDEASWGEAKPLLNLGGSYAYQVLHEDDALANFDTGNGVLGTALDLDKLADVNKDGKTDAADFNAAFGKDLRVWVATANAAFKVQYLTLAAEYFWMGANPDAGDTWKADGYYLQAGYQVLPKILELAARYSAVDSDDTPAKKFPKEFDKSELQFGVNYYLAKHNAKVQADYTLVSDDVKPNADDNVFRVQAQLDF